MDKVEGVAIAHIPIMLGSSWCELKNKDQTDKENMGECRYDPGGYFISKGCEKVIIGQERLANNFIYLFKTNQASELWRAEIKSSVSETSGQVSVFKLFLKKDKEKTYLLFKVRGIDRDLPFGLLMKAMGLNSDQ